MGTWGREIGNPHVALALYQVTGCLLPLAQIASGMEMNTNLQQQL